MSRLLALEWDAREARVVVARRRAGSVVIEQAFAEPWRKAATGDDASAAPAESDHGKRLGEILAAHGVRRVDTLVAVGRSNIELRLLALPPAPPEELPDLVRFQALKQFSSVGENWPIDFVPLDIAGSTQINVLAAAIAPELVEQIRKTCAGAEVDPKRLVLRPYAAASLWQRHVGAAGCVLMIDFLAEDADLTVLVDGQVGFIRTVRVPQTEDVEEQAKWLSGEAKRTLAAASNQLGGRRAERIVLCGDADDHSALRKSLENLVNLPIELFDPFDGLTLDKAVADKRPLHRGRYAPLLGMVAEEAAGKLSGIDFLNPRKAPPPPNRRKLYGIVGGVAASFALLLGYWVWSEFAEYERQLTELAMESAKVDADIKKLDKQVREAKSVDDFVAGDVTWLDELYHVSDKFLPAEKAIVGQVACLVQQNGGGTLSVEGNVKQSGDIDVLEKNLRDALHRVSGSGSQYDPRQAQYPWQFKESLTVPSALEAADAPIKPAEKPAVEKAAVEKPAAPKPTPQAEKSDASPPRKGDSA